MELRRSSRFRRVTPALPVAEHSTPTPSTGRVSVRALVLVGVVAVLVYLADQGAKALVLANLELNQIEPFIGELLQLHLVKNAGAAFSLGSGSTWIFAIIASVVAIGLVVFARRIRSLRWATVFGLLLGGTLGNLSDRLFREPGFGVGHVVDFLQLYGFPAIFNVADIGISAAMVLFILFTIRGINLDGSRTRRASKAVPGDAV